jgi:ribose 5-phosphate isomerase B
VRMGLGSDEIGFECKQRLRATVSGHGHAIEDVSTPDSSRSDIYSLVDRLASGIYAGRFERGVLVCASANRSLRSSQKTAWCACGFVPRLALGAPRRSGR